MRYQRCYSLAYIFLIAITLFAPEECNVPLKYVFIPLMFMLLFGIAGKGISLRLKFKPYFLIYLCWIALTIYSTKHSESVSWSPSARSFCLLLLFIALLHEIVPDERYMNQIKCAYIYMTLFCAAWIILQYCIGAGRQDFYFISGRKDVNYLSASMLPGVYMAMRWLFVEKGEYNKVCALCVAGSSLGILLLQSRAAFITLLSITVLCFLEYLLKSKLSKRKFAVIIILLVAMALAIAIMWNSPAFSRITDMDSYKDDVRLEIWESAIEAYNNSPIIGSGVGSSNYFAQAGSERDTHNNYIDILGDTGLVGICLFVLLCIQLLRVRKGERLHMFSFFIACMLPLGFINGLLTISFWLPVLLLAHEHVLIQRKCESCTR